MDINNNSLSDHPPPFPNNIQSESKRDFPAFCNIFLLFFLGIFETNVGKIWTVFTELSV